MQTIEHQDYPAILADSGGRGLYASDSEFGAEVYGLFLEPLIKQQKNY